MKNRPLAILTTCIAIQAGVLTAQCQTPKPAPAEAGVSIQSVRLLQKLQIEVQRQQSEIQQAAQIQQVSNTIIKDMALLAFSASGEVKNDKMQKMLAANGIALNTNAKDSSGAPSVTLPVIKPPATPDTDAAKFAPSEPLSKDMQADYDYLEKIRESNFKLLLQAKAMQTNLEKLVNDVLELSKTDAEAKAIVEKYNIKKNAPK